MKTSSFFGYLFLGALLFVSCREELSKVDPEQEEIKTVIFTIDQYSLDDEGASATRTALNGTSFSWAPNDTVGIYPNSGSQVYFEMTSGAGASSAVFDGGGWAFKPLSVYYSYYPFIGNIYLDRHHIPVSYLGQAQTGTTTDHIGPYDFMFTNGSSSSSSTVSFQYHHLNCIIRPRLIGLPAGRYTKLAVTATTDLFPTEGYYDLMSETPAIIPTNNANQLVIELEDFVVVAGQEYYVYVMSAPIAVGGKTLTISILDEQRKEFQCVKSISSNYNSGDIKGLRCDNFIEVPQSMGLIIDDWDNGGNIGGDAD